MWGGIQVKVEEHVFELSTVINDTNQFLGVELISSIAYRFWSCSFFLSAAICYKNAIFGEEQSVKFSTFWAFSTFRINRFPVFPTSRVVNFLLTWTSFASSISKLALKEFTFGMNKHYCSINNLKFHVVSTTLQLHWSDDQTL